MLRNLLFCGELTMGYSQPDALAMTHIGRPPRPVQVGALFSIALNPQPKGKTLEFETSLQGTPFDWRLTLKKGNASGLLHGTDRRPGKGGQGGEMVIEEHVVKK